MFQNKSRLRHTLEVLEIAMVLYIGLQFQLWSVIAAWEALARGCYAGQVDKGC